MGRLSVLPSFKSPPFSHIIRNTLLTYRSQFLGCSLVTGLFCVNDSLSPHCVCASHPIMHVLLHHLDLHMIKSTMTDRPTLQCEKPKVNLVLYIRWMVTDQDCTKGARVIS